MRTARCSLSVIGAMACALALIFSVGSASAAGGCVSSPSACGYPDATNTGVPAGTALTASGSRTVTTNGTVLNGLAISGSVTIAADNVTIENSRITVPSGGNGTYGVILNSGAENFTIVNSEITGPASTTSGMESAVWNHYNNAGATARGDYFHHCADCWEGSGTFEGDYMVVDAFYSGSHDEDIYVCGSTVNVNDSTLFNLEGQTATVFGDALCGGNNFTVTNSLLAGGGYLLYPQANSSSSVGTSNVSHNRFGRCLTSKVYDAGSGGTECSEGADANGYYPLGGYYGVAAYSYSGGSNVWTNNVWDDSSQPVCAAGTAGCGTAWTAPSGGGGTVTPPPPPPPVEAEPEPEGEAEQPAPPVTAAPTAVWTAPAGAQLGTPVQLDGTDSTGSRLTCRWKIEYAKSSQTESGCSTSYTFTAVGSIPVTLTVTDAEGRRSTSRHTVSVAPPSTSSTGGNGSGSGSGSGTGAGTGSTGSGSSGTGSGGGSSSSGSGGNGSGSGSTSSGGGGAGSSGGPGLSPAHAVWRRPRRVRAGHSVRLDAATTTGEVPVSCGWTMESAAGNVLARRQGCRSSYRPSRRGTLYVRLTVRGTDGSDDNLRRSFQVS
jgi:hypothetical protein